MAGRLSYNTPSVMELFNAEFTDFNGDLLPNGITDDELDFELKVGNGETMNSVTCTTAANCHLKYMRSATPLLIDTTPSQVCLGDEIQFNINAKDAHKHWVTPTDQWPFRSFRLGGTL